MIFPSLIQTDGLRLAATLLICWLCMSHAKYKYKYKLFPHVLVVPFKVSDIYNDLPGEKSAAFPRYHLDVNLDDPRFANVRSRLKE